ncbi:MAG: TraB/GumN family protein [Robiginitomaculum sp.]|nr:MAG: TraB/GumN family protein [Robiginitomaculum sp.]
MRKVFKKIALFASVFALALTLGACNDKTDLQVVEKQVVVFDKKPALWLVKDEDTNVYLFGTVHVLKPETRWKNPKFELAFAKSDVVYQEADVSEGVQRVLAQLVTTLGLYSDGGNLFELLDDAQEKEVLEAAEIVGLPKEALSRMKPWFAAIGLTQMHMVKSGYSVDSGVEAIITAKAKEAHKAIRYLETAEQQLRFLAELPLHSQVEFLVSGSEAIEDTPDMLDDLVEDWAEGDVAGIAEMISDVDNMGDRIVYNAMLVNRNQNWARQIQKLMDDEAGTFFIAVGAAHLAGDDSVIVLLRDQGETVVRQ